MAWDAIVRVVSQVPASGLDLIGAGPLEDLLAAHCASLIEQIEREASVNARYWVSLSGMWQSGMPDDLWRRVIAPSGRAGN